LKISRIFSEDDKKQVQYNGSLLFSPPKKLAKSVYICDSKFALDSIIDMYNDIVSSFGIVLISGKNCGIYTVVQTGYHIECNTIFKKSVDLQGKFDGGGQSQNRLRRIVEEKRAEYVSKMADQIVKSYMCDNNTKYIVESIIIGGPSNLKHDLMNKSNIKQYFTSKIKLVVDTEHTDHHTALNLFHQHYDTFVSEESHEVDDQVKTIKNMINMGDIDKLTFGFKETYENLKNAMLKYVIIKTNSDQTDSIKLDEATKVGCILLHSRSRLLIDYGNIIGIKWY